MYTVIRLQLMIGFTQDKQSIPSQIVENLLPVFALLVVAELFLQHHGDLRLREMELRQFAPNALLGHQILHQRPGGRRRLQITIVGDA